MCLGSFSEVWKYLERLAVTQSPIRTIKSHTWYLSEIDTLNRFGANLSFANQELSKLGKLGDSGRNTHAERELITWLGEPVMPKPTMFMIPCKIAKGSLTGIKQIPMAFMLPHVIFYTLYHNCRDHFNHMLLGWTKLTWFSDQELVGMVL